MGTQRAHREALLGAVPLQEVLANLQGRARQSTLPTLTRSQHEAMKKASFTLTGLNLMRHRPTL